MPHEFLNAPSTQIRGGDGMRRLTVDVHAEARAVPPIDSYPTLSELYGQFEQLAREFPEVASLRQIGTSRLGERLLCLSIQGGNKRALIWAGTHPNEPVGFRTIAHLAERLLADPGLRDSLGHSWDLVPCLDPDAMLLNEGWYAGPFTRTNYARHFFRPALTDQPEWTFPFDYKRANFHDTLVEGEALRRLIDEVCPTFVSSLHNHEVGGTFFYVNRASETLTEQLASLPAMFAIPLDIGEPEDPAAVRLAPAIFKSLNPMDGYDFHESLGLDPLEAWPAGLSALDYAFDKHNSQYLVTEVPQWVHPDSGDDSITSETYSKLLAQMADRDRELHDVLSAVFDSIAADLPASTRLRKAHDAHMEQLIATIEIADARATVEQKSHKATVAEVFSAAEASRMTSLRFGGTLLRLLNGAMASGTATAAVRSAHESLSAHFNQWCEDAETATPQPHAPIAELVGIQYGSILAAVIDLNGTG